MATSPTDSNQIDHLSNLPDELLLTILSLLPMDMAARTSILSRRFRYLWEASPSLDLCPSGLLDNFDVLADRALLRRNPSNPISSLRLDLFFYRKGNLEETCSFICSLLSKAHSFGVSHLTIEGFGTYHFSSVLPVLFSMDTLKSLSLDVFPPPPKFPSEIALTSLRTLSIRLNGDDLPILDLLSKLCALKDLKLYLDDIDDMPELNLSSRTITNLELIIDTSILNTVQLCLPSLESLHLKNRGQVYHRQGLPHFHVEVPSLKKVVIALFELRAKDVSAVHQLLKCISSAEELALHIKERGLEKSPIPILLEPGKDAPNFSNLKHLDVTVCFHGYNLDAVATMFHHSPALESINLVHEVPKFTWDGRGRKRKDWGSKLLRNDDGNHHYAYFSNLHIGDNRKEFMKWISKKCVSKRQACNYDVCCLAKWSQIWCFARINYYFQAICPMLC